MHGELDDPKSYAAAALHGALRSDVDPDALLQDRIFAAQLLLREERALALRGHRPGAAPAPGIRASSYRAHRRRVRAAFSRLSLRRPHDGDTARRRAYRRVRAERRRDGGDVEFVYRLSKRAVPELMRDVFGLGISVGAVVGCQRIASAALAAPVA